MGKENIEKYSSRYALLKAVSGFWHNNVFYRRVIVYGRENINFSSPRIFAPNHQNALMDALAVLFTHKGQPVFLARSDIFRKKLIAKFLYFLKMLPVYRIRDGYSTLKENDEIFEKTVDVLKSRGGLVILPEGDHAGFRRLRQLKKGICRIAFQAEEATGYNLKLKIIPVGLEYSHYTRYRQVLTVIYGKPIEVSDYVELYKTSPEKAFNELRERLSAEIRGLIVHIESEEDYEAINELRDIINGRHRDDVKFPKIFRDSMLIGKLNDLRQKNLPLYRKICDLSLGVKKGTCELNLSYRLLGKKKHPALWLLAGIVGLLAGLPLFLFGNIFNLTLLAVPNLQISKIKDPQFHSTIRYGLSLAMAFIFVPVFLVLSLLIFSPWWFALLIFLALPLSGLFAWNYYLLFRRITGGIRVRKLIKAHDKRYEGLCKNYTELKNLISNLKYDEK